MKDPLTSFYFPHDTCASHDPKLIQLRMSFGYKAIGMYWNIIEALHREKTGKITRSLLHCMVRDFYAQEEIRTSQHIMHEAEEFEDALFETGAFETRDGKVFSERVLLNLLERNGRIEKSKSGAEARWNKASYEAKKMPTHKKVSCGSNAIKEIKNTNTTTDTTTSNTNTNTSKEVLPDGVQTSMETKPDNRNTEINNLIEAIKKVCGECQIIYDKQMEREFSRHILGAKSFGEFSDQFGKTRVDMALEIIRISCKNPYTRGVCNGPKSIYQKYPKIVNTAIRNEIIEQGEKKDPNNLKI